MKKVLLTSAIVASVLSMSGCSDSEDVSSSNTWTTDVLSSKFIDSAVQGLDYSCVSSGETGVTDSEGVFTYVAGDECTFKVGAFVLGSGTPTGAVFTPTDITTEEPELTNILRLLQTLDTDNNVSNGIVLPSGITGTVALDVNFDAEINGFLSENNVTNAVVTGEDAVAHFDGFGSDYTQQ